MNTNCAHPGCGHPTGIYSHNALWDKCYIYGCDCPGYLAPATGDAKARVLAVYPDAHFAEITASRWCKVVAKRLDHAWRLHELSGPFTESQEDSAWENAASLLPAPALYAVAEGDKLEWIANRLYVALKILKSYADDNGRGLRAADDATEEYEAFIATSAKEQP